MATLGYGAEIQIGDGASPEVFTAIAGVKDFTLPTGTSSEVDVTAHDSPDRTREYIAGLLEPGSFSFDVYWESDETTHGALWTLKESGNNNNFVVVEPTEDEEFAFSAMVQGIDFGLPVDDAMTATITLKVAGAMTSTL